MPVGAVIGAGALGAGASVYGANKAASAQKNAANTASNTELQMFDKTQENLQPYNQAGQQALGQLQELTGTNPGGNPLTASLTSKFNPTMADLENTPGYKFSLDQGLKTVQNGFAAQGLASSGAAMKGGVDYAEGLAGTTYNQQFSNNLQQNQQIASIIEGIVGTGANAATGASQAALTTGGQIGSNTIGAGNAAAAGANATGNAISTGANSAASSYYQNNLLQQLIANQAKTSGGAVPINGY